MTVLGIITGIALSIFINLNNPNISFKKQQIELSLISVTERLFSRDISKNTTLDYENYKIEIEFTDHPGAENLSIVYCSAYINEESAPIKEQKILLKIND